MLALDAVTFAYPGAEAPVLADVSFSARPGQTVAVNFTIDQAALTLLLGTEPGRGFGDHIIWLRATDSNGA